MSSSVFEFKSLINTAKMILEAGGESAGTMEVTRTSVRDAYAHGERVLQSYGKDIDVEMPDFERNYRTAQKLASIGFTKRKDMPVIGRNDVREFQRRLKSGQIDVSEPFKPSHASNPFPEGLSGSEAREWLQSGLEVYDGDSRDDVVSLQLTSVKAEDLRPIQEQIYFDKSIETIGKNGAEGTVSFIEDKSILICSSDNYIIDGHHRFLSAILVDPMMQAQVLKVDLPIDTLLPMAIAYGDAIGNKRNL